MTEASISSALAIAKTRLNRLQGDTSLDETALLPRLRGSVITLKKAGIDLQDTEDDIVLLADYAVWRYQNRDQPGEMPAWLKKLRWERFLHGGAGGAANDP